MKENATFIDVTSLFFTSRLPCASLFNSLIIFRHIIVLQQFIGTDQRMGKKKTQQKHYSLSPLSPLPTSAHKREKENEMERTSFVYSFWSSQNLALSLDSDAICNKQPNDHFAISFMKADDIWYGTWVVCLRSISADNPCLITGPIMCHSIH